jgi:hypothetical protein
MNLVKSAIVPAEIAGGCGVGDGGTRVAVLVGSGEAVRVGGSRVAVGSSLSLSGVALGPKQDATSAIIPSSSASRFKKLPKVNKGFNGIRSTSVVLMLS